MFPFQIGSVLVAGRLCFLRLSLSEDDCFSNCSLTGREQFAQPLALRRSLSRLTLDSPAYFILYLIHRLVVFWYTKIMVFSLVLV